MCEARGLNHYLLEWFRQLTQIRENGLRRSRTPPTHTKCASDRSSSGIALGQAVAGLFMGTAEVAVTTRWGLCDSRLMQGSGDNRQLTSSCAHGYYHASGPCRLACTYTAAERAVPTAVSCVRAAMSDGPYRRVLMGHRRADGPCHVVRMSTAVEQAVLTAVSSARAAMSDGPCRRVPMCSLVMTAHAALRARASLRSRP